MGTDPAAVIPRRHTYGVRSVDHLDSSVRHQSERIPDPRRVRMHGAVRKGRDNFHIVRNWTVVIVASSTGAAGITGLASTIWWH